MCSSGGVVGESEDFGANNKLCNFRDKKYQPYSGSQGESQPAKVRDKGHPLGSLPGGLAWKCEVFYEHVESGGTDPSDHSSSEIIYQWRRDISPLRSIPDQAVANFRS
jgi:hypothetical protein